MDIELGCQMGKAHVLSPIVRTEREILLMGEYINITLLWWVKECDNVNTVFRLL